MIFQIQFLKIIKIIFLLFSSDTGKVLNDDLYNSKISDALPLESPYLSPAASITSFLIAALCDKSSDK